MTEYQYDSESQANETPGEGSQNPFNEFLRHQQRAFEETGKAVESLFPPGFREHGKEAGREFVKGMKVLVDAAISEVEKASREFDKNFNRERPSSDEGGDRPSSTGTTKVKVQVD